MRPAGIRARTSARVCLALGAAAGGSSLEGQERMLIAQSELYVNATLIDGRGGAPRPQTSILVSGGRVRDVGTQGQMQIPQGTSVMDLEGAFVVPGFIDAQASPRSPDDLQRLVAAGVTGVREGAMSAELFALRGRAGFGDDPSPLVYIGGPVIDAGASATGVTPGSAEAAVAEVDRQVDDGAEFISLTPDVPADWIVGIARAARRRDTPVWTDRRQEGWLLSLRAGTDVASRVVSGDAEMLAEADRESYRAVAAEGTHQSVSAWLDRLDPDGPEVDRAITALLSRDAAVIPLLAATEAPFECALPVAGCQPASDDERAAIRAAWPSAQAFVRKLHEEGVRLMIGSGAPVETTPGDGFHREMELLVGSGIPPLDVLSMATRNAAGALGQLHERGTIEPGKRADFLVLEGDPIADIRNARRISLLVIGGRPWGRGDDGAWRRVRPD